MIGIRKGIRNSSHVASYGIPDLPQRYDRVSSPDVPSLKGKEFEEKVSSNIFEEKAKRKILGAQEFDLNAPLCGSIIRTSSPDFHKTLISREARYPSRKARTERAGSWH